MHCGYSAEVSRRCFLAAGGLTVAAACVAPGELFAETDTLVVDALREAATAKIEVQKLRRNITVLLGAGGNIAVLTGPDGKLLVDAEIVTARVKVAEALDQQSLALRSHWRK